jgi:hypothetical protein
MSGLKKISGRDDSLEDPGIQGIFVRSGDKTGISGRNPVHFGVPEEDQTAVAARQDLLVRFESPEKLPVFVSCGFAKSRRQNS